jgi:hypothetical protein
MSAIGKLVKGLAGQADTLLKQADEVVQPAASRLEFKGGAAMMSTPQQKQLIKRSEEVQKYGLGVDTSREKVSLMEESGPVSASKTNPDFNPEYKAAKKKLKKDSASLSSAESNILPFDEQNPKSFNTKLGNDSAKAEQLKRGVSEALEQHHMFPKGMSGAFANKFDDLVSKGVATNEDLVSMAQYARDQGVNIGDTKANMKNMAKAPHNELHKSMRDQGAEVSKSALTKRLRQVKSSEDLMALWKELVDGDGQYLTETAEIWEELGDLISEIQG